MHIGQLLAKALPAEIVGNTRGVEPAQLAFKLPGLSGYLPQVQAEMIAPVTTDLQLALIAPGFQHLEIGIFQADQITLPLGSEPHTEPLGCLGPAVFHAGIAYINRLQLQRTGQPARHLGGGKVAFPQPQQQVLTGPGRSKTQFLLHNEVLGSVFDDGSGLRFTGHPCPVIHRHGICRESAQLSATISTTQ